MYADLCIWTFCSVWHRNLYKQGRSVFGIPKWILGIMVHIYNRWAESYFRRLVYWLSSQWPGICVGQSGTGTGFFSECFYLFLSPSFHQRTIFINCSPLWRFGWIPSHDLPLRDSRSYSDIPHSIGLLWTNDHSDAEISTWQHTTLTRDKHPCS
jgi:hypothetical protein